MKILLVIPRYFLTNKINYEYMFPLGLAYLSSTMKNAGYDVDCFNLNHYDGTTEELVKRQLNKQKYDFVCSGHTGIGYTAIEKIVNTAKQHPSKPKTIIGGPLVTSEPELIFKSLKPDFAVSGEGELTIVDLINSIQRNKPLDKVKGIIYWENNKPKFTQPREMIQDIDTLPLPDFEGLEFEKQLNNMSANSSPYGLFDFPRVYPIMCSRGCPFQCTFCYHGLGYKYRTRSIENVMNELKTNVKKYKINIIAIYDDLFSLDKKRLYEFCRQIKKLINELEWECKWTCQISVIDVDEEVLGILKDSGCYAISLGFESYSPQVLKSMKKPITPEQIDKAFKTAIKAKVKVQANFIFGDRAETKETAKTTLDYWKKNCKGQVYLSFIQPYPGSEIYHYCIKKGIIRDKLFFIRNQMPYTNWFNMTDNMTDEEVLELKNAIINARRQYSKYVVPFKIKKQNKKDRYNLSIKCPYCTKTINYQNLFIQDKLVYTIWTSCKNCNMRFSIVSPLYKFGIKHYEKIDSLKKLYLLLRDNLLKKQM